MREKSLQDAKYIKWNLKSQFFLSFHFYRNSKPYLFHFAFNFYQ